MNGLNRVLIIGTLGQDPEYQTVNTQNGPKSKVRINIATNRVYKKGNETVREVDWHQVEAWGSTAEYINNYAKRGFHVAVEGELRYDEWEDKDSGAKRKKAYISAKTIELLDNRAKAGYVQQNANENVQGYVQQQAPQQQPPQQQAPQQQYVQQQAPQQQAPQQQYVQQPAPQQQYAQQPVNAGQGQNYDSSNLLTNDDDGEDDLPF